MERNHSVPYMYFFREHWRKVNISFHDNGTVSYETQKFYFFERSSSVGSEDDIITTLNIPMMVCDCLFNIFSQTIITVMCCLFIVNDV